MYRRQLEEKDRLNRAQLAQDLQIVPIWSKVEIWIQTPALLKSQLQMIWMGQTPRKFSQSTCCPRASPASSAPPPQFLATRDPMWPLGEIIRVKIIATSLRDPRQLRLHEPSHQHKWNIVQTRLPAFQKAHFWLKRINSSSRMVAHMFRHQLCKVESRHKEEPQRLKLVIRNRQTWVIWSCLMKMTLSWTWNRLKTWWELLRKVSFSM